MNSEKITDIFQNWKDNKFVIIPVGEVGLNSTAPLIVVLSDIGYWNEHYDELGEWCRENSCNRKGMTVELPDEQAAVLFSLRWS